MTATQDDMIAELQRANAELRRERDAALAQRDSAMAQRTSDYDERTAYQAATIDVLKAMSASPGDAQLVFEAIARRATAFCEADAAMVALLEAGGEPDLAHFAADRLRLLASSDIAALFRIRQGACVS